MKNTAKVVNGSVLSSISGSCYLESVHESSDSENNHDVDPSLLDFMYEDCHDLINLPVLSENSVKHCLEKRFSVGKYYTQMRNHLISFNPGRPVPHLYSADKIDKLDQCEAHVFKLGKLALENLSTQNSNGECVVISGESGSGKTECCKYLLHFIISRNIKDNKIPDHRARGLEKRILEASPVLEAFGNAPTCYNRNSSRFGKFIELNYHPSTGDLLGGRIQTYLLEKTRILQLRSQNSAPFHVFYAMSTMNATDRMRFHVENLNSEGDSTPFITWDNLLESMRTLGIEADNITRITAVLSSLIMLSHLKFDSGPNDKRRRTHHNGNLVFCEEENDCRLGRISDLLGVNHQQLAARLTEHKFSSRRESVYVRPCTIEEITARVDTLMKTLYQLLFEWIVKQANKNLSSETDEVSSDNARKSVCIGVLDMYGFECFPRNRLEQLCINYANERLHQYFVDSFIYGTKIEYEEEEVPFCVEDLTQVWQGQQTTSFLELHLFPLLEEECRMQRAGTTAVRLATRLQIELQPKFLTVLTRIGVSDQLVDMCVRHYAGPVEYDLSNFLEQNADRVPADLFALLMESSQSRWLLGNKPLHDVSSFVNGHRRRPAVCTQFREAVRKLVCHLKESSGVQFVRCVKPCVDAGLAVCLDSPCAFDTDFVLKQLQSCGVLDTVRVCRAAVHPVRIRYDDFHRRYNCLFSYLNEPRLRNLSTSMEPSPSIYVDLEKRFREQHRLPSTPPRTNMRSVRRRTGASEMDQQRRICAAILHRCLHGNEAVQAEQYGRRRLFLKQVQSDALEKARNTVHHQAASVIQTKIRSWIMRLRFIRLRAAVMIIQRYVRHWLLVRQRHRSVHFERIRTESAIVIQRCFRRWILKRSKQVAPRNDDQELLCNKEQVEKLDDGANLEVKLQSPIICMHSPDKDTVDTNQCKDTPTKITTSGKMIDTNEPRLSSFVKRRSDSGQILVTRNHFRKEGILSVRFIPEKYLVRWKSKNHSHCHRLLPYSNVRPLYYGCQGMSGYLLSISNCL